MQNSISQYLKDPGLVKGPPFSRKEIDYIFTSQLDKT